MAEAPEDEMGTPPQLRFLKLLVTVLTGVMIVGMLLVVGLLITRLNRVQSVALPEQITLPENATARAFTQGAGWYAVVTDADQILIFGQDHILRQTIQITND